MVYDCFPFFNELDLLEIRLAELNPVVDRFVLVEATRTFQKQTKKLWFDENKSRFAKYLPKIEHIVVDEYPGFFRKFRVPTAWDYDNHQKDQIKKGLKKAGKGDFVLVGDLDEIPKRESVINAIQNKDIKIFEQRLYYYYLDLQCTWMDDGGHPNHTHPTKNGIGFWRGSVLVPFEKFKSFKQVRKLRDLKAGTQGVQILEDSGWHFSFMGGVEAIIKKLEAYTHPEYNTPEYKSRENILAKIKAGKSLFDKSTFNKIENYSVLPEAVKACPACYQHLFLPEY